MTKQRRTDGRTRPTHKGASQTPIATAAFLVGYAGSAAYDVGSKRFQIVVHTKYLKAGIPYSPPTDALLAPRCQDS
jgi:hypothetical protein